MKINAFIPCRVDSERIPMKNLRLLAGKPLPWWAARAAKDADVFDDIYLISGHPCMEEIADECGIGFHLQSEAASRSTARTDDFAAEFMRARPADITVLVNPTAPLLQPDTLALAVRTFRYSKHQSMLTISKRKVHAMLECSGPRYAPINFRDDGKLERTQDLRAIMLMAWAFMGWKQNRFLELYDSRGHAILEPPVYWCEVDQLSAIDLDNEYDWMLAERVLTGKPSNTIAYHSAIRHLVKA